MIQEHSCGTVVARRASGLDVRIFVVVVEPPTPSDAAPILITGTDLGSTPTYGGIAPVAQRTGRRTVIVDLPGTGHSSPSLDCPEISSHPGSAATRDLLVGAVSRCRQRLQRAGVEPKEMTTPQLAEDLSSVMSALGTPRWVLMGDGTTADVAVFVARTHPQAVEALVLDSPVQSGLRPAERLKSIVVEIAAACRREATCRKSYGDVEHLWKLAHRRLAREPITLTTREAVVVLDSTGLDRAARWLLAPSTQGPATLPAFLTEVVERRPGKFLDLYAATVAAAPPLCVGYLPKCEVTDHLAHGAVLSTLCPTVADTSDWHQLCSAWGVGARTESRQPVREVPVLALYGKYDPFADPADVRRQLHAQVPGAFVVEAPKSGHNVLADPCIRSLRNAWLAGDTSKPPAEPPCLHGPLIFS